MSYKKILLILILLTPITILLDNKYNIFNNESSYNGELISIHSFVGSTEIQEKDCISVIKNPEITDNIAEFYTPKNGECIEFKYKNEIKRLLIDNIPDNFDCNTVSNQLKNDYCFLRFKINEYYSFK
jgi:hypothetical protein